MAVISLGGVIYYFRHQLRSLQALGLPGLFLINILVNASLLLPAPIGLAATCGAVLLYGDPLAIGVTAGAGSAIGELSGYLLGYTGQAIIERRGLYNRIIEWMNRFGPLVIFLLAALPNPFFDLGGIAAGALRMPWYQFLFATLLGKIIRLTVSAYVCQRGGQLWP